MSGDVSLWESFPWELERLNGARRYVSTFRAPFQDLRLTSAQEHALRVCSLLAILPPPPEQKALPGGVPEDLSQDNLSTWAGIVQDIAGGMIVPPSGTDQIIFPHVVEILTFLESVSRVTFCCQCYLPGSACRCLESSFTTSTASTTGLSWSEVADPTRGPSTAPAGRGARMALPCGSSAPRQPRHPAGRAAFLERQLEAISKGKTPPPDLLRLPQSTWDQPATQNRRRVQLPPPPPKSDSGSTIDQSRQTTAQNPEPGRQGTQ